MATPAAAELAAGCYPAHMTTPTSVPPISPIGLVGFDGDDTLWKSEDYYRVAEQDFETILGHYIDLHDAGTAQHLLKVERRNLEVFGYGAKGMTLSMIEAAIELTDERISAAHLRQIGRGDRRRARSGGRHCRALAGGADHQG